MSGPRNQARPYGTESADIGAKSPRISATAVAAAVLCAGISLIWLSWSFLGQVASDRSAAEVAGAPDTESVFAERTLPSDAGTGESQHSGDHVPGALGQGAQNTNFKTDTQVPPGDAQANSPANGQAGAGNISGDPTLSDTPFDEASSVLPIAGWVLDQDGAPVAGIEVTASARRLAQRNASGRSVRQDNMVYSDELGYFAFDALPEGEYLLTTEATDDFDSARSTVRAGFSSAILRVRGDGGKRVRIRGSVTNDENQPIAGVRVSPTDETQAATSDSGGFYDLVLTVDGKSRTRSIRFTKPGYHSRTLGVRQSELRDVTEWPLDAQLQAKGKGVPVDGTVLGANGDPVPGAQVQLSSSGLQRSYRAVSATDGSFYLDDVDVGDDYRIWVRATAGYRDHVDEGLQIGTSGAFLPVSLEPQGTGSLSGRMVNAFLEPIPRYTLWMWNDGAGANRSLAVTSDSRGGYRVEEVPAGEVAFSSHGQPQFAVGGITLEPDRTITADLVLDWGREELTGRVVNSNGKPLAGAEVRLFWSDQEQGIISRSRRRTVADGEGYFVFTELGPGPHVISVTADGHRAARFETTPGEEILIQLQETAS